MVPGLQGLMSRSVGPDQQGALQGANQSLMGLAGMIGPSLFGLSFAWAVSQGGLGVPGLPHFIAAALTAGCLALALGAGKPLPAALGAAAD
jgi:DHA1 family tetracycline resistance protein-like MFS transporter